jgi:hypothetical protein
MTVANINVRTDSEVKAEATQIFEFIGLDMSTAINIRPPRELISIFEVDDPTNKRHAQGKTLSVIAILVCRDFEDFDFSVDILNQNMLARNAVVFTLFFGGKLPSSGLFLRCFTVFV